MRRRKTRLQGLLRVSRALWAETGIRASRQGTAGVYQQGCRKQRVGKGRRCVCGGIREDFAEGYISIDKSSAAERVMYYIFVEWWDNATRPLRILEDIRTTILTHFSFQLSSAWAKWAVAHLLMELIAYWCWLHINEWARGIIINWGWDGCDHHPAAGLISSLRSLGLPSRQSY